MASLNRHNGGWRIRFYNMEGKRKSLYPGKMPKKNAQQVKTHVEALVAAKQSGTSPPPAISAWLNECPERLRLKLYQHGLIEKPQESALLVTLKELSDRIINDRSDVKESTRTVWKRCRRHLLNCFQGSMTIQSMNIGHAHEFRKYLIGEDLSEATIRKTTAVAALFLSDAVEREEITKNPFKTKSVPRTAQPNRKRDFFITREMAEQVIEACPDDEWRLIFALSRFGGLRCPSETLSLT